MYLDFLTLDPTDPLYDQQKETLRAADLAGIDRDTARNAIDRFEQDFKSVFEGHNTSMEAT